MNNVNKIKEIVEFIASNGRSRAASVSVSTLPEPREYYMDKNGKIVSKPITKEKDPCVSTTLGGKAASVPEQENKAKAIAEFMFARRY